MQEVRPSVDFVYRGDLPLALLGQSFDRVRSVSNTSTPDDLVSLFSAPNIPFEDLMKPYHFEPDDFDNFKNLLLMAGDGVFGQELYKTTMAWVWAMMKKWHIEEMPTATENIEAFQEMYQWNAEAQRKCMINWMKRKAMAEATPLWRPDMTMFSQAEALMASSPIPKDRDLYLEQLGRNVLGILVRDPSVLLRLIKSDQCVFLECLLGDRIHDAPTSTNA